MSLSLSKECHDVNIDSKEDPDFLSCIDKGENHLISFETLTIEDCFEYETSADMSDSFSGSTTEPNSAPCSPAELGNLPLSKIMN